MLNKVSDRAIITRIEQRQRESIERQNALRLDWIENENLVAVPCESGYHFTKEQAALISKALQQVGCRTIYATAAERLEEIPTYWALSTEPEDLLAFSREFVLFNFALLSVECPVVILCTTDDFFVVAGPRAFVENACGEGIGSARKRFRETAFEPRLLLIADRYEATGK